MKALGKLQQIKGRWARASSPGSSDWQVFYEIAPASVSSTKPTGFRMVRTAWFEKPRKNGKSTECSARPLSGVR